MEHEIYNRLLLPDLRIMLAENDTPGLREFCEALYPAVSAEVLESLDPQEAWKVISNCAYPRQAEILGFISLPQQMEMVNSVDRNHLSRLIEAMAPDDRVDMLERMDSDHVESLMPLIAQAERSDIRKLLSYPEGSAGAIMTTEYASLPEDITVSEAINRLRQQAPDRETIYYVFILDEGRHLHGLISLRELILAKPAVKLADIMQRDVISVRVHDDQEFVAEQFAKYDFLAMPVVDDEARLVGIITHDDILDVMQEEATEDAHRLGAVEPFEDSYLDTPLHTVAWKRGMWLVLLLFAALGTSTVLSRYGDLSKNHGWLVWFVPLVLASGGNAGSQSATLIIRSLALKGSRPIDTVHVAARELIAGMLLGLFLGSLGFLLALLYVERGRAVIVGTTVSLVVVMGSVTGAMLPILFKRLGMDPALMSNPLIAALSDVLGLLIYYNVATLILDVATG